jgi:cytochrome c
MAQMARALLAAVLGFAADGSAASLPVGDAEAGEALYARCFACHALAYNRTGPKHCGLLGRRAASVAGFEYSDAMRRVTWIWDRKTLDRFLADPAKAVPGTTMGYAGIKSARERADLIAYLERAGRSDACASSKDPE